MPHDNAFASSVSSRSRHLRHFLFLTYLVTLLNTSGFLSAGGVVNFLTGINTLVIYMTYSLIYLLPAAILIGMTDAFLRWPIYRRRETPVAVAKKSWLIWTIAVLATAATQIGLFADKEVFRLFGMHLNGFVWNTIFSNGGIESTGSGKSTVITYIAIIIAFPLLQTALALLVLKFRHPMDQLSARLSRRAKIAAAGIFVLALTGQAFAFAFSDIRGYSPILVTSSAFPLYQRITFRHLAEKLGFDVESRDDVHLNSSAIQLNYPARPLDVQPPPTPLNIVWLVSESLRGDMLNPRTMPKTWAFSEQAHRFTNHYSGGNGTRMGMFSMFYGLYGSYWFLFLQEHRSPVLMDILQEQGYQIALYTSARFTYPEFDRTLFARIPKEQMLEDTSEASWTRDRRNIGRMIEFIKKRDPNKPFMTFEFFESPHAPYQFPPECEIAKPFLEDVNYATMDVKRDMSQIKARYINSCNHVDSQVDRVVSALREENLLDSTIVIFTGDHGEEFMEKGRWGHNSEFTEEQIRPPFVLWIPGTGSSVVTAISSHLDIPATLLPLLGVKNPTVDYSQGINLLSEETHPYIIVADWSRIGLIDSEYKATLALDVSSTFRNPVTDRNDVPITDRRAFFKSHRAEMMEVLRETRRFGK